MYGLIYIACVSGRFNLLPAQAGYLVSSHTVDAHVIYRQVTQFFLQQMILLPPRK